MKKIFFITLILAFNNIKAEETMADYLLGPKAKESKSIGDYVVKKYQDQNTREFSDKSQNDNYRQPETSRGAVQPQSYGSNNNACGGISSEIAKVQSDPENTPWLLSVKTRRLYELQKDAQRNSCR